MRCKACDKVMEDTEIIYYEDIGEHEELCSGCLKLVRQYEEEEDLDLLKNEEVDVTTIIDIEKEYYDD